MPEDNPAYSYCYSISKKYLLAQAQEWCHAVRNKPCCPTQSAQLWKTG